MLAGAAALSGTAFAGELDGIAPVGSFLAPQGSVLAAEGTTFKAKGKETVKLRFAGRIHLDYNSLSNDGTDAAGDEPETTNGFFFRRLRFGTKAELASGWKAEVVYDFSDDGSSSINTAYVQKGDIKLGHTKVPFGYEQLTSSNSIKGIERSIATRQFVDELGFGGFKTGIHYDADFNDFTVRAFAGNADAGANDIDELSQDFAFFASVQWSNDVLTIGGDYGYQATNDAIGGGDFNAGTAYVNYSDNGLNVLAEYFTGSSDETDADTDAFNVHVAYKHGKWEPVLRLSYVESDNPIDSNGLIRRAPDATPDVAGEILSFYAGVNYYYSDSVRILAGYELAEAEDVNGDTVDDISGFRARFQLVF